MNKKEENYKSENIYQKLARIRNQVSVIKKSSRGFRYKYTKEEDILIRITGLMDKYGLSLIPSIKPGTTKVEKQETEITKYSKTGAAYEEKSIDYKIVGDMTYKWVNNDNPEDYIEVPWTMVATMADAAQAFGSALTYSSRYFLLKFFNIANSEDDPDAILTKRKEAMQAEEDELNNEILQDVGVAIKSHLAAYPEDREQMVKLTSKYVKGGDYRKIKTPALSSKLLREINELTESKKGE